VPWTDTDTDTHYTTQIYAGTSKTTTNTAATNPYLKVVDDNTYRSQIQFIGSGSTAITSDANGKITISSTDTTYPTMGGATLSANGTSGLVPAPTKGQQTSFLRGDGTWTTLTTATTISAGLMSANDKIKLNGITDNAEINQNAFSNIQIGNTTIEASSKTDYLTFSAGNNITLTPNTTNNTIAIAATNTTYNVVSTSADGLVPKCISDTTKFLRSDGTWAVPADSDKKVYQSVSSTEKYRAILLGTSQTSTVEDLATTTTGQAYINSNLYVKPSNGTLYVPYLKILSTEGASHITFAREGMNYITAPNANGNGAIAFNFSSNLSSSATSLIIGPSNLYPAESGKINLGSSDKRWNNLFVNKVDCTGLQISRSDAWPGFSFYRTSQGSDSPSASILY
jgi:hypothetical protein